MSIKSKGYKSYLSLLITTKEPYLIFSLFLPTHLQMATVNILLLSWFVYSQDFPASKKTTPTFKFFGG